MQNSFVIENPKRKGLIIAAFLTALFAVIMFAFALIVNSNLNTAFGGLTIVEEGKVSDVLYVDDTLFLELEGNSQRYCMTWVKDLYDWELLIGKQVALDVPQNDGIISNKLVFGVTCEGTVLADADETLQNAVASNTTLRNWMFAIASSLTVGFAILLVLCINTAKRAFAAIGSLMEKTLAQQQPKIPKSIRCINALLVIALALTIVSGIVMPRVEQFLEEESVVLAVDIAVLACLCAMWFAPLIAMAFWTKRTNQLYLEKYPFEQIDTSLYNIPKKIRADVEKRWKFVKKVFPQLYYDYGNGVEVQFCQDGLQVFDTEEMGEFVDKVVPDDAGNQIVQENTPQFDQLHPEPLFTLDYSQLNFEAVAMCKHTPLFVVVKSRMEDNPNCDADVHLLLTADLLRSLQTFNVSVENLDYILQHKDQFVSKKKLSLFVAK